MPVMTLALCVAASFGAASPSSLLDTLLPAPQRIEAVSGEYAIPSGGLALRITATDEASAARLKARIEEAFGELKLTAGASAGVGEAFSCMAGEVAPDPAGAASLPDSAIAQEQGYLLRVESGGVRITAATERGLFYGAMTLAQLLAAAQAGGVAALPAARIVDWPALEMRGPHEDYGRDQLPTLEEHKRAIRAVARFKMNTYFWFIEPDHFVYSFDPNISAEYDRFTFDEIRELVAYARERYVEVIPAVELLAHMEMTLRHEAYKRLAEDGAGGGTICPTSEEAFGFVRRMVDEIAPAFGGRYFHCGLDESQAVGQGSSADAIRTKGVERVYADYYTRLHDAVAAHGQQMIMYADIALNHPGILDLLPKDIVMMFWDYAPRERYEGLDTLKGKGFPLMALSGLWDWNNLYPVYPPAFQNMTVLARQAAEVGALGHFVSDWGDGYRGAAGINLTEWAQFGYVFCGAVSWNARAPEMTNYARAYATQWFGVESAGLAEALVRLARCQGEDLSHTCQARRILHDDARETWKAMAQADEPAMAFWQHLRDEADAVHGVLAGVAPPRNADQLRAVDLAARLLTCAADIALTCRGGPERLKTADSLERNKLAATFDDLAARHKALWAEYEGVWRATNRPLNLVHLGRAWGAATDSLAGLARDLRAWQFPGTP